MIRYLAIILVISVSSVSAYGQDNIFTLQKTIEFAQYQYSIGNCEIANQEYLRASYFGVLSDTNLQFALSSSICSNNLNFGKSIVRQSASFGVLSEKSKELYSSLLLLNRDFQAYRLFVNSSELFTRKDSIIALFPSYFVLNNEWDKLHDFNFSVDNKSDLDILFYQQIEDRYNQLRFKKPWLSALMSTVIPGSGKLYTGEWQDGLFTMVLVGVLAWQTTNILTKKRGFSVLGYTGAAIGGSLYISNIYGSFRSARNVNNRKLNKLYDQVDQHLLDNRL